jgi:hypothetical protein
MAPRFEAKSGDLEPKRAKKGPKTGKKQACLFTEKLTGCFSKLFIP